MRVSEWVNSDMFYTNIHRNVWGQSLRMPCATLIQTDMQLSHSLWFCLRFHTTCWFCLTGQGKYCDYYITEKKLKIILMSEWCQWVENVHLWKRVLCLLHKCIFMLLRFKWSLSAILYHTTEVLRILGCVSCHHYRTAETASTAPSPSPVHTKLKVRSFEGLENYMQIIFSKRGNLVHSLPLKNEFTCHISYLDLSLLASVVRLRIDINMYC